jgi:hypothetical protein
MVAVVAALASDVAAQSVVYTGPSASDRFVAANPTARLVSVDKSGARYRVGNRNLLLSGPGTVYQDGAVWQLARPRIEALTDNSGWALKGTAVPATLVDSDIKNKKKRLRVGAGATVMDWELTNVRYLGQSDFEFDSDALTWKLRLHGAGASIWTVIAAQAGKRTYSFKFLPGHSAVKLDSKGRILTGDTILTSRAAIVGANKKTYPCTTWSITGSTASFTCDDAILPKAAYPYTLDPSSGGYGTVDCQGYDFGGDCHVEGQSYINTFWIDVPSGAVVSSADFNPPSISEYGEDCTASTYFETPSGTLSAPWQHPEWFNLAGANVSWHYSIGGGGNCSATLGGGGGQLLVWYQDAAAPPTFSPGSGVYASPVTVTLSTSSPVSIRYTTDGSTPSATWGNPYFAPFTVSSNTTVKAIATGSGYFDSSVTTASYTFFVTAPTFSPSGGTYTSPTTVTLSTASAGASIRYTTDGNNPTCSSGAAYTAPFPVAATATVKAIACLSGWSDSSVSSATYSIVQTVSTPTISPGSGSYGAAQSVTLSTATSGASIRYTIDGSTPTSSNGTVYSAPVNVASNLTLKAIAYKASWTDSSIASATYTLVVAAPTLSPAGGSYTSPPSVTLSTTTSGASIRYTTDGNIPTCSTGTVYSAPFAVTGTSTVKAVGCRSAWSDSSVSSAAYTVTGTVATPTFSVGTGTYSQPQSVTITTSTSGGSIRYTTDGSTPTSSTGTLYSGPVSVAGSLTLKAMAYKTDWLDSALASASFTMVVATPSLSPTGGTHTSVQSVTIATATPGTSIRYTTDGGTPTSTSGTVYASPVPVGTNATVKAIAYRPGWTDSSVASETYTIVLSVASPAFAPSAGTYNQPQNVTLTTSTSGASIRYTVDGSAPTSTAGTLYSAPVGVSNPLTLKAIAYKADWADSAVASAVYGLAVATPSLSPSGGAYTSAQSVTISTATPGTSIRYTTDGSTPSPTSGTAYAGPIAVGATTTVKAIAYRSGWTDSPVTSEVYTILLPANVPTFTPAAGTYTSAQSVTITTTTSGASIRYTTDGSTPTSTTGAIYTGAVAVGASVTLKAIAYKSGMSDSSVSTAAYTITGAVATPEISPGTGTYSSAQTVTISSSTPDASIRYTIDGSVPTSSAGTLYGGPFSVASTATVKAIGYRTAWLDSTVATVDYTMAVAAPNFSPTPGTYPSPLSVTITSATPGVSIRYTTDGSIPTSSSGMLYTDALALTVNSTVKAIAYKAGWSDSVVTTGQFTVLPVVSQPTASPTPGTYVGAQVVALSSQTAGASIRYTLDGTIPTTTTGTLYTAPFQLAASATLKAIAFKPAMADSAVVVAAYSITDLQISFAQSTAQVQAGSAVTYNVLVTPLGGFTGTVSLTASGLPPDAICNCPLAVAVSGAAAGAVLTISTTSGTPSGTFSFALAGTVVGPPNPAVRVVAASLTVVPVPDFILSVDRPLQTVSLGNSATYNLTLVPVNGWTQPVTLRVAPNNPDCPASLVGSFQGVTVPELVPNVPASMTLSMSQLNFRCLPLEANPPAPYRYVSLFLNTVLGNQFSLSVPSPQTVTAPAAATFTITAAPVLTFTGTVSLSASGLPVGATYSFTPSQLSVGPSAASTTMTVSVPAGSLPGAYPITVTAVSGTLQQTVYALLTIRAPVDFSLSAGPATLSVPPGGSTRGSVLVNSYGGFSNSVSLNVSGLPPGAVASLSQSSVQAPGFSAISIQTNAAVRPGRYPLRIAGSSGVVVHDTTADLCVSEEACADYVRPGPDMYSDSFILDIGGGRVFIYAVSEWDIRNESFWGSTATVTVHPNWTTEVLGGNTNNCGRGCSEFWDEFDVNRYFSETGGLFEETSIHDGTAYEADFGEFHHFEVISSSVRVSPPPSQVTLKQISWAGERGSSLYKTAVGDWRQDKLDDDGSVLIKNPVWRDDNLDGTPELTDPIAVFVGSRIAAFDIALTASSEVYGPALLKGVSGTAGIALGTEPLSVSFSGREGVTMSGLYTTQAPSAVDNIDLIVHWSISWDRGTTWSPIGTTTQKVFVILALSRGLQGGNIPGQVEGLLNTKNSTAARLDWATQRIKGATTREEVIAKVADMVGIRFGTTIGDTNLSDRTLGQRAHRPWLAWEDVFFIEGERDFDCISKTVLAAVVVLQIGVDAKTTYAYPTTDPDATNQETAIRDNKRVQLSFLLDSGEPNFFEAFLFVCDVGAATQAYTFAPRSGAIVSLPVGPNPCADNTIPKGLAFAVLVETLKGLQGAADNESPDTGKQWWSTAEHVLIPGGWVPFPTGYGVR